jgi:pimeloyl-ACP methyl ester carboxylesterase
VSRVVVFEPPFIVDGSFPPIAESLAEEVATKAASGDGDGAAALFFGKGMGIPAPGIWFMRCMLPAWGDMTRIAGTAAYDLRILHGTQAGKPLPAGRWAGVTAPVVVAVGGKSEPFFHSGGQAAAKVFREARFVSLDGLDHSAVLMAPEAIAALIRR